ncbi:hypothetical protein SAMN05444157_3400 [Frankineae bacterium MT45]|nr:hypothetical protein SAMN05444157_3400 [Frankineae bacterium MT45]
MTSGQRRGSGRFDSAQWLLAVLQACLAPGRHDWGAAMRAELAGIDEPPQRRRFARSCGKVIVGDRASLRSAAGSLAVVAALVAGLAVAITLDYRPLRLEAVGLILVLAALSAASRRGGRRAFWAALGPVTAPWPGRVLRAEGYVLVGALTCLALAELRADQREPASPDVGSSVAFGLVALLLVAVAVTLLMITSQRSPLNPSVLAVVATCSAGAGLAWYGAVLVTPYIDPGLVAEATLLVVALAAVATGVATGWFGADGRLSLLAGLSAAVFTSLVVFAAPQVTYTLVPQSVPDPSPGSYWPQPDAASHQEQDRVEAADPYVGLLLIGGVLTPVTCALLAASSRRPPIVTTGVIRSAPSSQEC